VALNHDSRPKWDAVIHVAQNGPSNSGSRTLCERLAALRTLPRKADAIQNAAAVIPPATAPTPVIRAAVPRVSDGPPRNCPITYEMGITTIKAKIP
jgi:hypothetical protein